MPSREVMHKFKAGALHSGGPKGPVVRKRAQAIAILLSERANEEATGSADRRKKPKRTAR